MPEMQIPATKKIIKLIMLLTVIFGSAAWFVRFDPVSGKPRFQQWSPNSPAGTSRYIGDSSCAKCHQNKSRSHASSAMADALATPADAPILRNNPELSFRNGQWTYRISRKGNGNLYTITDGTNTLTIPILWAFGRGTSGQTYVVRHEGRYYETRVSYFTTLKALDFTPGAPRNLPESLPESIGQPLTVPDAMSCFGCHSTVAPGAARFQLDNFRAGIGCEACHGPGEKHVELMKAAVNSDKLPADSAIFNPRRMHPDEMSQQLCGACHRSWETVMQMPDKGGMSNVRFQPYRITNSRCYKDPDDGRISCTACHDAHENPRHDPVFYDSKCTACHQIKNSPAAKTQTAPACPTGKSGCVTCHMPKTEPPGLHFKFTDHYIRIVRAGEEYPK